jgi:hypothetical protein
MSNTFYNKLVGKAGVSDPKALYKTAMCKEGDNCTRGTKCSFAHSAEELRKKECSFFKRNGICKNGTNCTFSHDVKVEKECKFGLACRFYNSPSGCVFQHTPQSVIARCSFCGGGHALENCERREVRAEKKKARTAPAATSTGSSTSTTAKNNMFDVLGDAVSDAASDNSTAPEQCPFCALNGVVAFHSQAECTTEVRVETNRNYATAVSTAPPKNYSARWADMVDEDDEE